MWHSSNRCGFAGILILRLEDPQSGLMEDWTHDGNRRCHTRSRISADVPADAPVRRIAVRHDFVDRPDAHRKIQDSAVALGGGAVVLLVTVCVVVFVGSWWGWDLWLMARNPLSIMGLAGAALLLVIVGLIDDAVGVRGSYKLFWQVVAAALIMGAGLSVPRLGFLNIVVSLGFFGSLFTIAWLLGAINSFNLIDGIDGLAGSVGVVFSITFGLIALYTGDNLDSLIAFALAGSLLGFLRFNFPPATIYLGDAGSMLIGLILGTIALRCTLKQTASLAFAAPLAIWSIPMFDAMAAIVRRKLTGRSIYATDRGHFHHVLLTRGMNTAQAVSLITGLCVVTSAGAMVSLYYDIEWFGILVVMAVIGLLIATRIFGHVEFLLVNTRLLGFGRFLAPLTGRGAVGVRNASLNIQGTGRWERLWGDLIESADRFGVIKMQLNLSLPRLHEEFYAIWSREGRPPRETLWSVDVPLVVDDLPMGRLCVSGLQHAADSACPEMCEFLEYAATFEAQLAALIRQQSMPATTPAEGLPGETDGLPQAATISNQVPAPTRG